MGKYENRLNQNSIPMADEILSLVNNLPAAGGGEDLQSTVAEQTTAVNTLLKMVSRKIADHKGEGEYVWKKSKPIIRLPEGYTEIEYIETTGTQYIDTGFSPNQDTRVVMDADVANSKSLAFPAVFATDSSSSNKAKFVLMLYNDQAGFHDHYNGQVINSSSLDMYGRHIFEKNKNITLLDDKTVSTFTYSAFQSDITLSLFSSIDSGTRQYYAKVKMYSCQVYDNDVLIRDFVPCKNVSDTVGLYDTVNAKVYPNNGSGTFTAGDETVYRVFEGYVVGLSESAYPNGGELDGYWYESLNGEGQYLWKKTTAPVTITMTQQNNGTIPTTFKMTGTNVDLLKVDVSYFVGLKGTYDLSGSTASFEIKSDGLYMGTSLRGALTYDPSTQVLSCAGSIGSICTWILDTAETTVLGYVLSSDSKAYPDGGTQDGFWYEMMGTDEAEAAVEIVSTTSASERTSVTIAHSMGDRAIAIVGLRTDSNRDYSSVGYTWHLYAVKGSTTRQTYVTGGSEVYSNSNVKATFNNGSIALSNIYKMKACPYTFIIIGTKA